MPDNKALELLDLPLPENDAKAATVRDYLIELVAEVWRENECFSGKRPFGNSNWEYDLYVPMVRAGLVPGKFDEDGDLVKVDHRLADELVAAAIKQLGAAPAGQETALRESIAANIEAYQPAAHPVSCPPSIAYQAAMETAARIAREGTGEVDRG